VVWALVLVAIAAIGVLAMMRAKPAPPPPLAKRDERDEPDEPPRVDSPRHGTQRPKQILTPTGSSQPLPKPVESEPPVTPVARAKASTIPPAQQVAAESGLSMRTKRPSSSPPLSEGGVVVRMRPPSQPPPMMGEPTKRGTPGTGVVIRAKPPTAPPLLEGPRRGTPGSGVPTGGDATAEAEVVPPSTLANKLRYATLTATISHVGIDARREDGFARTVMWPDVVGIVARRLPAEEPYEGTTFIDIVSTAGATLRILPWTRLAGDRIDGEGTERARALVQLAAARCPGAKLDAATRTFLGSHGQAAQLPDEPTLAAHDQRLS
jgi:hypothetical protein